MTKMTDLIHNTKTVVAIEAKNVENAGDTEGKIIDTEGFYAVLFQTLAGGAGGITALAVEQSDDDGMADAEAVPATNIIGTGLAQADDADAINVVPTKRYVRIKATTAEENVVVGAVATLFGADIAGKINL